MEGLFVLSALAALFGTLIVVAQKNAVYALLGLLIAFAASAGIFVTLDAPFIAVSQILVYAGALAVMFLFVLMFTDTRTGADESALPLSVGARPDFEPTPAHAARGLSARKRRIARRREIEQRIRDAIGQFQMPVPLAVVVSLGLLLCFAYAIFRLPPEFGTFAALPADYDGVLFTASSTPLGELDPATGQRGAEMPYGSTAAISRTMFEGFPLAFEVVGLVIFAALLGAVLLARRHLGPQGTRRGSGGPVAREGDSHA
jgi:NADH:ubiquinone oxidoreductase subunit 6 (subunit J)